MSGSSSASPIGVFDSGVGGLTVARALIDLLPDEQIVYLGDTARGPYGPRDLDQVRRFSLDIIDHLAAEGAKAVVAACNTATAALTAAEDVDFPVPVVGVIAPAVRAAARATRNGRVGVIGTVGTITSRAYDRAIEAVAPDIELFSQACPRFVELVETGRTTDPDVLRVTRDYLAPLQAAGVDTVILGCTHYPLLTGVLSHVLGGEVVLISSAEETARWLFSLLVDTGGLAPRRVAPHRFIATGDQIAFSSLATRFLGPRLPEAAVEHLAWRAVG